MRTNIGELAPGLYFLTLQEETEQQTRMLLLVGD
jgi:hypothetical protein